MAEVASTNDCAGPERRDPDLVCDVVGEVAEDGLRDTNACANSDQPTKHNRWCPRRRLSPNDLEHAPTGSEQLNGTRSRQLGSHHDPPPHPHPHTLSQLSEPGSHLPVPSSHLSPRSSQRSILSSGFSILSTCSRSLHAASTVRTFLTHPNISTAHIDHPRLRIHASLLPRRKQLYISAADAAMSANCWACTFAIDKDKGICCPLHIRQVSDSIPFKVLSISSHK